MPEALVPQERHLRAVKDPEEMLRWKTELLARIKVAMAKGNIRDRLELVSEVCFLFSAEMAYDAAKKTKALMVAMRDVHGMPNEEIDTWLNGKSSTPGICILKK